MSSGLEVVAHPTGPWLVRAGKVVFAVPAAVGRPLVRWHGKRPSGEELGAMSVPAGLDSEQWIGFMVSLADALDGCLGASDRLPPPIWLRVPLMQASVVRWLALRLAFLTGRRGLLGLLTVGLAGYLHLGLTMAANPIRFAPDTVAVALGLFLISALWHELGHAAALARHGYPPGGIGLGLLFVIPVLFTDVTAVGVLPRAGRLRVDVAGVVFQFGLGGMLAFLGLVPAAWLVVLAVGWSLFPFVRADGYWLVCDWLGLADLETDLAPASGWRLRYFLRIYRLTNAAFLLGVGFVLPWRYARRVEEVLLYFGWSGISVPLAVVAVVVMGFIWWNIFRRVKKLIYLSIRQGL